jgi:hypothetical protein
MLQTKDNFSQLIQTLEKGFNLDFQINTLIWQPVSLPLGRLRTKMNMSC